MVVSLTGFLKTSGSNDNFCQTPAGSENSVPMWTATFGKVVTLAGHWCPVRVLRATHIVPKLLLERFCVLTHRSTVPSGRLGSRCGSGLRI